MIDKELIDLGNGLILIVNPSNRYLDREEIKQLGLPVSLLKKLPAQMCG